MTIRPSADWLIARMIRNSSREGEVVYDPFCGSGSTLLAAHNVAITLERMAEFGLKPELVS